MAYDKNLTGVIGKNERKAGDTHPDIKGNCEIDGVAYWIDGWRKERNDGSGSFYSLKFKAKDAAPAPAPAKKAAPQMDDDSSDIPF